jgi:uncharacterized membrane protein
MPIHWNAFGQPDSYAARWVSLSLLPLLMGITTVLLHIPTKTVVDDGKSRNNVDAVMLVVAGMMLGVHLLVIVTSVQAISTAWVLALMGGASILLGMAMPTLPQNYLAGVRTPWTLGNENNWRLTHRFSALSFCLGGAVCALLPVLVQGETALSVGVSSLVVAGLLPVGYSYLLHATQLDASVVEAQTPAVPKQD